MRKVGPKAAYLTMLQNFDVIEKMDLGFGISDQKLITFDQFQAKYILAVEQCYQINGTAKARKPANFPMKRLKNKVVKP